MSKPKHSLPKLRLGALPVDVINRTLGYEIDPGEAVLDEAHQIHAAKNHPGDYARCLPHVAAVIANPLYLGDDFKNPGKIELVGRVAAIGGPLLVAVNIATNAHGEYEVSSFYPISEKKVQNRREKSHLKLAQKT